MSKDSENILKYEMIIINNFFVYFIMISWEKQKERTKLDVDVDDAPKIFKINRKQKVKKPSIFIWNRKNSLILIFFKKIGFTFT